MQNFKSRVLLGAGSEDDILPAHIYTNTRKLAAELVATNGDSFFFEHTGHSIHAERPDALGRRIMEFLTSPMWESLGGTLTSGPAVARGPRAGWTCSPAVRQRALPQVGQRQLVRMGVPRRDLTSDPAAVSWGPGRIDVFARGTDNALYHKWYDGNWSGWESLGGMLTSGPAVCSWASGRLDVFARGTDNAPGPQVVSTTTGPVGSPSAAASSSDPAAVSWAHGRIDVFAEGADNTLHHRWYDGNWSDWESLGGSLTSGPTVSSWAPGRLDVFARGTDNTSHHKWYESNWSDWESLGGGLTSDPAAVSWGNGRIDVFARGTDNALWHKWYDQQWRP